MYRIGIDLGGTNIAAGLVNEKFEIIAKDSMLTWLRRLQSRELRSFLVVVM